jgi:DNA-binding NarL/FixJ family response regulator
LRVGFDDTAMVQILIVEDNAVFRHSLKQVLSVRFPFMAIAEAADSTEALAKVDTLCPDLVFMDIRLPGVNGLELARRIKSLNNQITVIVLTTFDCPEYREAAHRSGASHFFAKGSATSSEILQLVEQITSEKPSSPCIASSG